MYIDHIHTSIVFEPQVFEGVSQVDGFEPARRGRHVFWWKIRFRKKAVKLRWLSMVMSWLWLLLLLLLLLLLDGVVRWFASFCPDHWDISSEVIYTLTIRRGNAHWPIRRRFRQAGPRVFKLRFLHLFESCNSKVAKLHEQLLVGFGRCQTQSSFGPRKTGGRLHMLSFHMLSAFFWKPWHFTAFVKQTMCIFETFISHFSHQNFHIFHSPWPCFHQKACRSSMKAGLPRLPPKVTCRCSKNRRRFTAG